MSICSFNIFFQNGYTAQSEFSIIVSLFRKAHRMKNFLCNRSPTATKVLSTFLGISFRFQLVFCTYIVCFHYSIA